MKLITFSAISPTDTLQTASIGSGGITSPKAILESRTKSQMTNDLQEAEKASLIGYRRALIKRTKLRKQDEGRKLRKRLDKYSKPLPVRITEDIKREKSIQGDSISPII